MNALSTLVAVRDGVGGKRAVIRRRRSAVAGANVNFLEHVMGIARIS
jgi:hypothetical protein